VCEVAEAGDIMFSRLVYAGMQAAAETYGWETAVREAPRPEDQIQSVNEFLQSDCDLIVTYGFVLAGPIHAAAPANPNQKFLTLDVTYDPPLANVRTQSYATDQAAFLAGYVAASATRTGKVGTFGGIKFPAVTAFMDGFARGVAHYNQQHGTQIEVLGWDVDRQDGLFTGNFDRSDDGRRMGQRLLDEGADILLPVAGAAGLGAAAAVHERGGAYLIGVDVDWTLAYPEYADIVLTSILKRLDVSVERAVESVVEGAFTGGPHLGTLETAEVGLAPFYELEALVPAQVKADLEQIRLDIIAGRIQTRPSSP
jgi:basic membrane protein A